MTWKHLGTEIGFDSERAEFVATIGGVVVTKPSLEAMKKAIAKHQISGFKPFEAICLNKGKAEKVTVTGISKKSNFSSVRHWIISDGRYSYELAKDSPKNLKLVEQYLDKKSEHEDLLRKHESIQAALRKKITFLEVPKD